MITQIIRVKCFADRKEILTLWAEYKIAESISSRLAQEVLAASVNGEVWDLSRPINDDATVKLLKWEDEEGKHAFWHSSAHLMAEALQELYPGIKFGIGPAIENGFYYEEDPLEAGSQERRDQTSGHYQGGCHEDVRR